MHDIMRQMEALVKSLYFCNPSVTPQTSSYKTLHRITKHNKIRALTRSSFCKLLFTLSPSATLKTPASPRWLPACKPRVKATFETHSQHKQVKSKSKQIKTLTSSSVWRLLLTFNISPKARAPAPPTLLVFCNPSVTPQTSSNKTLHRITKHNNIRALTRSSICKLLFTLSPSATLKTPASPRLQLTCKPCVKATFEIHAQHKQAKSKSK